MLRSRLICCLLCTVGIPTKLVRAGEPKTADEVIARYVEAIGGRAKLDAIKTRRVTGKMIIAGGMMEAPFSIEYKRPNRFRMDFTFQGMTGTQAFDGTDGWSVMPFAGKTEPEKMSKDEFKRIEDQADVDGPLIDYKKKGHQVELVGQEEIEGAQTYKLKVTKKNGDVEYYFLDAEYFLPIKVKGSVKVQGTDMEYEQTMSDYKEVGGVLMSHSLEQTAGGMGGMSMALDKIEINMDLPDSRFVMPEVKKEEPKDAKPDSKPDRKKPEDKGGSK